MDRKQFLELCQKYAVLPDEIMGKKRNAESCSVALDGRKYFPFAYQISFDKNGKVKHIAILQDCNLNSLVQCDLERVKNFEIEQ